MVSMGKKMNKCKAPGCSKWVVHEGGREYCHDHQRKLDPISSLYVDKSPRQQDYDQKVVEFFSYLLKNRNLDEMLY